MHIIKIPRTYTEEEKKWIYVSSAERKPSENGDYEVLISAIGTLNEDGTVHVWPTVLEFNEEWKSVAHGYYVTHWLDKSGKQTKKDL